MKKSRKKIVSIEPQLNALKVEEFADGVFKKSLDAAKRKPAPTGWKILHQLMEVYYREPLALSTISEEGLRLGVAKIRSEFPNDQALAKSAYAVLGDLQDMRLHADDIMSLPGVEADLPKILAYAITAGFRYGVLVRRAGAIKGKGKSEHPAWPFIRAQWVLKRKTSDRPRHNEVIFDGIADYESSIGAKIVWDYSTFTKPFSRQVIAKCRV